MEDKLKRPISTVICTLALLAVPYLFTACSSSAESPDQEKPNVLLIMVDDLKPAIGAYGDETAITPEMDKLASEGIRFDAAYSNQAVCAPSRYNLMLGSRSTSTGIYNFGRNPRDFYPNATTLPQYFKENGYHTEAMGKVYHIGHNTYDDSASWSVPSYHDKVIEYNDPESTPGNEMTREEALFSNKGWDFARSLKRGAAWESPDVADTAYADGRVAARAKKRLQELSSNSDKPFFLAVGFARPHLPFSVPQKYWDMYNPEELPMPQIEEMPEGAPEFAGKTGGEIAQYTPVDEYDGEEPYPEELKRNLIHGYYAGVSYSDTQIGKVLDELKKQGLDENTIVVLWGDHGFHLGELNIWTKHVNYEKANRIPIMIKAPGVTEPGTSTGQLTETVDLYPTLADLAGLSIPDTEQPLDGESLVPVLKDPKTRVSDYAYHAYPRGGKMGRAIRTDRYRLVEWKNIGADPETAEIELYDYSDGSVEEENIADEKPEVVKELRAILNKQPEATKPRPRSDWD